MSWVNADSLNWETAGIRRKLAAARKRGAGEHSENCAYVWFTGEKRPRAMKRNSSLFIIRVTYNEEQGGPKTKPPPEQQST